MNDNSLILRKKDSGDHYKTFDPSLDGIITNKELEVAFKRLKNDKAPGPDRILSEYLKAFKHVAENTLLRILYLITMVTQRYAVCKTFQFYSIKSSEWLH